MVTLDLGCDACLLLEALAGTRARDQLGSHQLESSAPTGAQLLDDVDRAHASLRQGRHDAEITGEDGAWSEAVGRKHVGAVSVPRTLLTREPIGRTIGPMLVTLPPRRSAVDACAEAIQSAILSGEYPAGSRLPAERTLAERLGVNRVTVRSALTRLSYARLLQVRQGSGYLVRDYQRECGPSLLSGVAELARSRNRLREIARDLLMVRRHLARAVLERARGAGQLSNIEAAVKAFELAVAHGATPEQLADADVEVLRAILDATGSVVLGLCLNPVIDVLRALPELRHAVYADAADSVAGYRVLLDWLGRAAPEGLDAVIGELERRDRATLERLEAK